MISAFGLKATELAGRIGDAFCTTAPEKEAVDAFREKAGPGKLVAAGMKVCWDEDEAKARATAHRLWPNLALPGELSQILPTPAHFEQACELVSESAVAEEIPCGPDLQAHFELIDSYVQADFDELYIQQVGDAEDGFFELYAREVLPRYAVPRYAASARGDGGEQAAA